MAPKNKTPEQTRKLLREAREELDKAQQPLLEQLARCTGPETPWMMAAAGRDDARGWFVVLSSFVWRRGDNCARMRDAAAGDGERGVLRDWPHRRGLKPFIRSVEARLCVPGATFVPGGAFR